MSQPLQPDQIVQDYVANVGKGDSLSGVELTVCLVYTLEMEWCNGGLHQFFRNPSGDRWEETLFALKTIKAAKIAAIFEKALTIFHKQNPSKDQVKRVQELKNAGQEAEMRLWELDGDYTSLYELFPDEDSYAKLAEYIASQQGKETV